MGNEEAGRPLATLSRTPGNPKSFQRSEKWMPLTAIANQISRNPRLVKWYLHREYVIRLTKINQKSKANTWYTSGHFQDAKMMLVNGSPQPEEEIDYEVMGLKW